MKKAGLGFGSARMLNQRIRSTYAQFPRQFWLMIVGLVISTAGSSMVWPFLLIYATARLGQPLGVVAPLISVHAGTGLLSSFIAGTMADRIGRKTVMNISLTMSGLGYFFLANASTYLHFLILMVVMGFANPLYQVGADAMLADLIAPERRSNAYSINRMASNAGFAMGPAVGGFLASRSYHFAFYGAASGFAVYTILLLLLARETLARAAPGLARPGPERYALANNEGYAEVVRDRSYLSFISLTAVGLIAPTMLWILLPVYAKANYGLPESLYGWLPTTNALMCVFVQLPVTQLTKRYRSILVTAAGMLVYAFGTGSVALMTGFGGFWLSMVVLTLGELILVPTASKYVADLAPAHLRGRYMSIYWLAWGIARTSAPLIGGFLSDYAGGRAIWLGGLGLGLASAAGLFLLSGRPLPRPATEVPA